MEETDIVLSCDYCRVRLCIIPDGIASYYLEPNPSVDRNFFYVPYLRFKGTVFSTNPTKISNRIVDTTQRAIELEDIPFSMGLRPQVLKLKPLTPKTHGKFLRPTVTAQSFLSTVKNNWSQGIPTLRAMKTLPRNGSTEKANKPEAPWPAFSSPREEFTDKEASPQPKRKSEMNISTVAMGEVMSLIYSPFFVYNGSLYDAVNRRPITRLTEELDQILREKIPRPPKSFLFLSAMCPECGWDLDGKKDSVVMICENCSSVWLSSKSGLKQVNYEVLHDESSQGQTVYLPFWKMQPKVTGLKLTNFLQLAKLANLPRVHDASWVERGIFFWVPAFRLPPSLFVKFSRRMTLGHLERTTVQALPKNDLYPVHFRPRTFFNWLKLNLFDITRAKHKLYPNLGKISVLPQSSTLTFVPFHVNNNELIEPTAQLRLSKNSLRR